MTLNAATPDGPVGLGVTTRPEVVWAFAVVAAGVTVGERTTGVTAIVELPAAVWVPPSSSPARSLVVSDSVALPAKLGGRGVGQAVQGLVQVVDRPGVDQAARAVARAGQVRQAREGEGAVVHAERDLDGRVDRRVEVADADGVVVRRRVDERRVLPDRLAGREVDSTGAPFRTLNREVLLEASVTVAVIADWPSTGV